MNEIENKIEESIEESNEKSFEELKEYADKIGMKVHPAVKSAKTLKKKIEEYEERIAVEVGDVGEELSIAEQIKKTVEKAPENIKPGSIQFIKAVQEAKKQAFKPILIILTDLSPAGAEFPTEIVNFGNQYFHKQIVIKKDVEQLVPSAAVKSLEKKTMVKWVPQVDQHTKRPTGNKMAVTVPRYNIKVIDTNP